MLIAVMSDIHGNYMAAKAVIDDVRRRGADIMVSAGDMVSKGPMGNEVLSLLRTEGVRMIMGGAEQVLAHGGPDFALPHGDALNERLLVYEWDRKTISESEIRSMANLPFSLCMDVGERAIDVVHASSENAFDLVFADARHSDFRAMRVREHANVLVYGHIHRPFIRTMKGLTVINAGSVGQPFDGDIRASYALLEIGSDSWSASIVRVDYDVEATIQAAAARGMPGLDTYARMLREARYPYDCGRNR